MHTMILKRKRVELNLKRISLIAGFQLVRIDGNSSISISQTHFIKSHFSLVIEAIEFDSSNQKNQFSSMNSLGEIRMKFNGIALKMMKSQV